MTSGDDTRECPLCMEGLELDDINFFPCTCGYQVCRFCWHRIRTNENGLCPACRKLYPENPAEYIPITAEEIQKSKGARKQVKKRKNLENRKNLEGLRVIRRNLVFVMGLPPRLADPDVLRRHEYFGKFGKIQTIIINSNEYPSPQGPSLSAYVTFAKKEDAGRAIKAVHDTYIDGRYLKVSFGTSKYCVNFLKSQPCLKPDCLFLHELGEEEASFTKEEMQMGKHIAFEEMALAQLAGPTKQSQDMFKDTSNARAAPREPASSKAVARKESEEDSTEEMMSKPQPAKQESPVAVNVTESLENNGNPPMEPLSVQQIFNDMTRLSVAFNPATYQHPVPFGVGVSVGAESQKRVHNVWDKAASEEEEEEKLLREALNSVMADSGVDLPEVMTNKDSEQDLEKQNTEEHMTSIGIGRPLQDSWAPCVRPDWPSDESKTFASNENGDGDDDLEFEPFEGASRELEKIMNDELQEVAEKVEEEGLKEEISDPVAKETELLPWQLEKRETDKGNPSGCGNWEKGLRQILPSVNINFANTIRPQHVVVTSSNSNHNVPIPVSVPVPVPIPVPATQVEKSKSFLQPQGLLMQGPRVGSGNFLVGAMPGLPSQPYAWNEPQPAFTRPPSIQIIPNLVNGHPEIPPRLPMGYRLYGPPPFRPPFPFLPPAPPPIIIPFPRMTRPPPGFRGPPGIGARLPHPPPVPPPLSAQFVRFPPENMYMGIPEKR